MSDDFESFKAWLLRERERVRVKMPSSREGYERMWRELCGDELDRLLASRESTEQYVRDLRWEFRLAAISILRVIWGPSRDLAVICEKTILEDPHPEVKGVALTTLGVCLRGTNDLRVGALLARVVHDPHLPKSVRECAYQALFDLRGIDVRQTPDVEEFRAPEDIDWTFVDSFLENDAPSERRAR